MAIKTVKINLHKYNECCEKCKIKVFFYFPSYKSNQTEFS